MNVQSVTDTTLESAAKTALSSSPHRTKVFDFEGRRYVAKRLAERPRRLTQTLFTRWLVKQVTGQPLPLRTLALSEAANSMDFEANRIRALAAAGVRVPNIAFQCADFFVLEHCGDVVSAHLEHWLPQQWRPQLLVLARELAEFHRAGQWHGGAQIKNITLQDGLSTRIDFEENFGEFLPLPVAQATDLVLFLNSISLAGPIDEREARHLLPQLLDEYWSIHHDPAVRDVVARTLPWLRGVVAGATPFKRWSKKGIRRVEILSDILNDWLKKVRT